MFTGITEHTEKIESFERRQDGARLRVNFAGASALGDELKLSRDDIASSDVNELVCKDELELLGMVARQQRIRHQDRRVHDSKHRRANRP